MMFPKRRGLTWCLAACCCCATTRPARLVRSLSLGSTTSVFVVVGIGGGGGARCRSRAPHRRYLEQRVTLGGAARDSPADEMPRDDDDCDYSVVVDDSTSSSLMDYLRSMRARELKSELDALRVNTRDVFEKEELVRRLYDARMLQRRTAGNDVGDDDDGARGEGKTRKKKRRRHDDDDEDFEISASGVADARGSDVVGRWTITTPFTYYELGRSRPVVAARNGADDGTVYIRPSPGRYASIKVRLLNKKASSSDDETIVEWTLLVDTACTGLVLSPNAVRRANEKRPDTIRIANNAGTMTMAGSSSLGTTSVARWDERDAKMTVGGVEIDGNNVAACQDIGALPAGLDGILGLSFLGEYACVDFDFANDELRLDREHRDPPRGSSYVDDGAAARGALSLTRLRVYAADVILDGRGPVRMLVDTGAASTFLNRKGVADMRLSLSSSTQIEPIRGEAIGAMGADNLALRLTHRYQLKRRWNLVAENTAVADFCAGIELKEGGVRNIDIGDLPVLEALGGDGVGGILGADLMMMCDVVRFSGLNTGSPRMILMQH